jgi:hypothetical protein
MKNTKPFEHRLIGLVAILALILLFIVSLKK